MTVPDFQALMLPVLELIAARPEARTGELGQLLATRIGLTEADRALTIPSGKQPLIANRTHWAVTYMVKAGLLERTRRGFVRTTDRGREVVREKPEKIDIDYLKRFAEFVAFRDGTSSGDPEVTLHAQADASTPDETIRAAHGLIEAALRTDLLDRILVSKPAFFERLVVQLLLRMGFGGQNGATAGAIGGSGDGGLDGVIDQDALGLDRVYIQAKRYARDNSVGPTAIRDFFGSLDIAKAAKGVFITTSSFTRAAAETAERLGKRIVLIDGDRLAALMIRYDVGVRIEETFHVKKIDEDFFLE